MRETKPENPLDFLPEALVDEMLKKHHAIVSDLGQQLREVGKVKESVRIGLQELGLLKNVNDLLSQRSYATTVGVDGSYVIIKQLSLDTVAVAAVAVEGLVPPKEPRHWEKPQHIVNIFPVEHHPDTTRLCRGIMFSYELELACKAPHRVVFLDGSLTSQLIGIGQSLSTIKDREGSGHNAPAQLVAHLKQRLEKTLKDYLHVLLSPQVDRVYVGVPKYSSRSEVLHTLAENGLSAPILKRLNDKGILSTVLKAGDVVGPIRLIQSETDQWHISGVPREYTPLRDRIIEAISNLHVLYFKPSLGHPALRLEIGEAAATNRHRLSLLLEALLDQSRISGVIEPYPIHIADLFVKQISGALSELREAALSELGEIVEMNFADVYLSLHDYRTEGGFD